MRFSIRILFATTTVVCLWAFATELSHRLRPDLSWGMHGLATLGMAYMAAMVGIWFQVWRLLWRMKAKIRRDRWTLTPWAIAQGLRRMSARGDRRRPASERHSCSQGPAQLP
jgi:hypothetical protein